MTLPNRPGYVVSDKKNPPSQQTTPQQPQTPTHENLHPKMQMPQPQPTMNPGYDMDNLGSLAPPQQYYQQNPYAQQEQMMRMAERGSLQQEPSVDMNPNPFKTVDPFRQQLSDPTQARVEEMQTRKQFIKYHRLLSPMVDLLTYCKKEGIIPPIGTDTDLQASRMSDFGLDDFINSQGIELSPLYTEDQKKNQERQEFVEKLEQLKMKYNEELEKLNRVLSEFCTRAVAILQEQSQFRTVTEVETHLKVLGIQQKFDYVRNQLRQNVCNAILVLQKQYNQMRKKRRTLSKRATEGLTNWFFEHLNDPYPSEEEKSMLAAHGGLTITQVNNWFGNKSPSQPPQNSIQAKMPRGRKQESIGGPIHPQQQPNQYPGQFPPQFFQQPPSNPYYQPYQPYGPGPGQPTFPHQQQFQPQQQPFRNPSSNANVNVNANANANAQYANVNVNSQQSDRVFWAQYHPSSSSNANVNVLHGGPGPSPTSTNSNPSSLSNESPPSTSTISRNDGSSQSTTSTSQQAVSSGNGNLKPQSLIPSLSQQFGVPASSLQSFPAYKPSLSNESYGLSSHNGNGHS